MLTQEQREWLVSHLGGALAAQVDTEGNDARPTAPPPASASASASASSVGSRVLQTLIVDPPEAMMALGESLQFSATGDYDDGTSEILTGEVDWSSSSDAVSIGKAGQATVQRPPNASGSQTITATLGQQSASATVRVASLESIHIEPLKPTLPGGNTLSFKAWGWFSDGQRRRLTAGVAWASSASDVVAIEPASGTAKARHVNQTAVVTATWGGGRFNASTTVTVATVELRSLTISPSRPQSVVGESVQLKATGRYSDNSEQDETQAMTWASAPPGIVFVDDSIARRGLATAGAEPGTAQITATDPNNPKLTATVSLEVIARQVSEAPDPGAMRREDQHDAHAKGLADGKAGTHAHRQALADKGEPGLGGRLAAYDSGWKDGRKAPGALLLDARVGLLVQQTQVELSENVIAEYGLLPDPSGYASTIDAYKAVREELADDLKAVDPLNSTEEELGASFVSAWKAALKEAGELRRSLAQSVGLVWDQPIREEAQRLDRLSAELAVLRAKHARIEADLKQGEHAMDAITLVLQVGDAAEMIEKAVESVHEKASKAALMLAGAEIVSKSQIIEKSIENLNHSYAQLALVAEGVASIEELDRALEAKVEAIDQSVQELVRLKGHQERAQASSSIGDPALAGWAISPP